MPNQLIVDKLLLLLLSSTLSLETTQNLIGMMPPKNGESAKKQYIFTLSEYTDEEFNSLKRLLKDSAQYATIGTKASPDSSRPQLQGYVCFKKRIRFSQAKSILGNRCNVEPALGVAKQNRVLSMKNEDYWEHGFMSSNTIKLESNDSSLMKHGGRSSGQEPAKLFLDCMKKNIPLKEFMQKYPTYWCMYGDKYLMNYYLTQEPDDRPTIAVAWIHGPTGSGKSRYAHNKFPEAYPKNPNSILWDHYRYQKEVIIDNFDMNHPETSSYLRWFDRYKCTVEITGGSMALRATRFIITSIFKPHECIGEKYLEAFLRRIRVFNIEQGTEGIDKFFAERAQLDASCSTPNNLRFGATNNT